MKAAFDDAVGEIVVGLLLPGFVSLHSADQPAALKWPMTSAMALPGFPAEPVERRPILAALPVRFSLTIFRRLASAAAQQTGLPVCVLVIEPGGNWSMISARPMTAESGSELLMPLPQQIRSGVTP